MKYHRKAQISMFAIVGIIILMSLAIVFALVQVAPESRVAESITGTFNPSPERQLSGDLERCTQSQLPRIIDENVDFAVENLERRRVGGQEAIVVYSGERGIDNTQTSIAYEMDAAALAAQLETEINLCLENVAQENFQDITLDSTVDVTQGSIVVDLEATADHEGNVIIGRHSTQETISELDFSTYAPLIDAIRASYQNPDVQYNAQRCLQLRQQGIDLRYPIDFETQAVAQGIQIGGDYVYLPEDNIVIEPLLVGAAC